MELTTLLTIKRQPDTTSSSSPLLSKTGTANPCPPEEGLSTANQPMSQAASLSCQSCQAGRKQPKHVLPVPLFCFCLFHTYFCPMCLPVSVALLIKLLPSVFFNHPPCHFSFFSHCPSGKWLGLQGYNHTRLIVAAKTSMAARAPATV